VKTKDLLSIADITSSEMEKLIFRALTMKRRQAPKLLKDKALVLLFEKPSLRTRVSFEVGIRQLGGSSIYLSPEEVGLGKREPVADVARVLSRYVHGIIARTFAQETLQTLAHYSTVPVINALSDMEHPCQALADILTVREKKGRMNGLKLAYIGDGNNVARSLVLACALNGVYMSVASPQGYELDKDTVDKAKQLAIDNESQLHLTDDPGEAVKDADVVYTDVWTSMGQEAEAARRRKDFARYQVNAALLSLAKSDVIFMHPMPAHQGEEIASGVLDGPHSVVFDQAENRLHLQKALLADMLG
jgi:ornithine carbamoyltransferase